MFHKNCTCTLSGSAVYIMDSDGGNVTNQTRNPRGEESGKQRMPRLQRSSSLCRKNNNYSFLARQSADLTILAMKNVQGWTQPGEMEQAGKIRG
ncbi:hypothetical protein Naga_100169g11 [Nannochloropsis gaditana]|uniref:Uncharacterized protein n=1 Tax=Nannochloropsis gaditana TaxID=72520 RepID=W7T4D0_9STRA|nr:hypothetical protein Naga_100169g11 [Nannochloropsis gaditana]